MGEGVDRSVSRVVVALGGNALERAGGDGSWEETREQMRAVVPALARVLQDGHDLVITHGNGPQVGQMLRESELASREVPSRPLDVVGARTQGEIGYLIVGELEPALRRAGLDLPVLCLLGRSVVDPKDPAFRRPTKPIGRYYSESEANLLRKGRGWTMVHDAARGGWRRLVPSPRPLRWVEGPAVSELLAGRGSHPLVLVLLGGGGIPVVERGRGRFVGVEAVIDKDLGAALIARTLRAETLAIVTDVPGVAIGFRKRWEQWLGAVTARELAGYREAGEFGEGTMAPKVEAALDFLARGGRQVVITDAPSLSRALKGEAGTRVTASRRPNRAVR
jgi:carbamate kinase